VKVSYTIPITVTAVSGQSKSYGSDDPVFTFTSSNPSATFSGKLGRAAGESVGTYAINRGSLVGTNGYVITAFVPANFTISPATGAALDITSYSGIYDATAHSIAVNNAIAGDTVYFSRTNNGSDWTTVLPTFTGVTAATTVYVKVTNANYIDRTGSGTVEITARPITITADSNSKVYDGSALSDNGWSLTSGTLATGELISAVTVAGTQTVVGSSANVPSAAVVLAGETNVTANYDIIYANGTLEVTPATGAVLDITSYSGVYDAAAHSIAVNNTIAGDTVYFSLTADGTDWTTVLPTFTNVTAEKTVYVKVTNPDYVERGDVGTVEITARPITVTADSKSKILGKADPTLTYTSSETVGFTGALAREAGEAAGIYAINIGTLTAGANYRITFAGANLTINSPSLSISKLVQNLTSSGEPAALAAGYTGDVFRYTITVTNNGDLDLTMIKLTDDHATAGTAVTNVTNATTTTWLADGTNPAYLMIGDLTPGEKVTFTYDYTSTAADIGSVMINGAAVKGTVAITLNDPDVVFISGTGNASITVDGIPLANTGESGAFSIIGLSMLLAAAALVLFRKRLKKQEKTEN
jgi:uncharacterized repeat protein (TIGR01451 family)/LPXTG-motif cell wall-anchored protein